MAGEIGVRVAMESDFLPPHVTIDIVCWYCVAVKIYARCCRRLTSALAKIVNSIDVNVTIMDKLADCHFKPGR